MSRQAWLGTDNFPIGRDWDDAGAAHSGSSSQSVAIIMRTKDRPVLLPRALNSVLSQTHSAWHLYLVNDGGNAETVRTCVAPTQDLFGDRLTIIDNAVSKGMEGASNVALALISEDFLAFLDDDDTWHPDFLNDTVAFLNTESRYAAVTTRSNVVVERIVGNDVIEERREDWFWSPTVDLANLLSRNCVLNNSLLFRMSVVKEVGFYNERMPVLGDWDYAIRVASVGDIGTIDKRLSNYHQRPASNAIYGNTVISGQDVHKTYDVLYRNSLIRSALNDPSSLGILHTILRMMEEHKNSLLQQLMQNDRFILRNIEETRIAILKQTVENDTILLRALNERVERMENRLQRQALDLAS